LKPNLNLTTKVGRRIIHIKTNAQGMRWHEVNYEKPDGKIRVTFVGDSMTFGCWSDNIEKSFVGIF
jgi:hypothetical protein